MNDSHIKASHSVSQTRAAVSLRAVCKKFLFKQEGFNDSKDYSREFWALRDIDLEVSGGEVVGIIGRNGAGKTTLLNIIAGVFSPTDGMIASKGRVLGLFNLGVGFQDELTGKENIFLNGALLGASRKEIDSKISSIIEFSELRDFIDMPLGAYSQGMRLRLGFSIIANLDFDILLVDEVLAVGDALFQSKCFERLMDFRRAGKTLIITTQNMELIERLCDKVLLLDHGRSIVYGNFQEVVNKYRALLISEKFFVGPEKEDAVLVENTKKWSGDIAEWGRRLGTKEAAIQSVEFINRWGIRCKSINTREPLRIKVSFSSRDNLKEPHFGVAIFRNDGVYCYGPNTYFDGHHIQGMGWGKGWFELRCKELLLAPGEYKVSVAIWDKSEALPFDYHNCCYTLKVSGYKNLKGELSNIPCKSTVKSEYIYETLFRHLIYDGFSGWVQERDAVNIKIGLKLFKLTDSTGEESNVFAPQDKMRLSVDISDSANQDRGLFLWLGIYRDDWVLCQGLTVPVERKKAIGILFPRVSLLPGGYYVSARVIMIDKAVPLMLNRSDQAFRVLFNRRDHGTVYLEHDWLWRLP